MDERMPPRDRLRAAGDFIRDGTRLAHDLRRELELPTPLPTGLPSAAIIDGLAAVRGWTVTIRVATADEWTRLDARHGREHGDVSTGEVRSTGPGAWEIVVIPGTSAFYRENIALTLLAHVVRDDVPLTGRARLASGGTTYNDAVARVFAREIYSLLMHPAGWTTARPTPDPIETEGPSSRFDRIMTGVMILWGSVGLIVVIWAVVTRQPDLWPYVLGGLGVPALAGFSDATMGLAQAHTTDEEDRRGTADAGDKPDHPPSDRPSEPPA